MKLISLYLFALLLASGCQKGPQLSISEEVLVKAMADTHIAEAAVQNLSGVYKDSMKRVYFQQVLEIHQIEENQFRRAMDSLAANPEALEKIIRKVESRLADLEAGTAGN